MAAGLGVLGLSPETFWRLTIPELNAALRGRFGLPAGGQKMSRAMLDDLMTRFPD